MSPSPLRRLAAAAIAAPVLVAGLVATPAQAAQTSGAELTGGWLADQLNDDGLIVDSTEWGEFTDIGLTIDVYFALASLEVEPEARQAIVDALEADPAAYVSGGDAEPDDRYAGALGKASALAQEAGLDPTTFGGWDLIAELEGRVQDSGRATDVSTFEGDVYDYSNGVGQSWVVRALTQADSELADEAANFLAGQQCANGGFPVILDADACATDIDATAFAVQALQIAQDNEVGDYASEINAATARLAASQTANGSWLNGDGVSSANSTGLVATVLSDHGYERQALKGAKWVHGVFVSTSTAVGQLSGELGAIAFDANDLNLAKANGITDGVRAKWVRASAQAATALDLVEANHLYTDVPANLTFFHEITWLAGSGITQGYIDGTFRPSQPVLREQIATFYYRAAGATYEHEGAPTFTDVPPSHTFYDEIEWFADQGITEGYIDGTFRPSQPVLREQVATFFYRYVGAADTATGAPTFIDVPTSHTFYHQIEWFAETGITEGYIDGTYRGSQPVLREQIATFFYRAQSL